MKQFYVNLTYLSLKHPQRVIIEADNADDVLKIAEAKYPNATIRGPSAVLEVERYKKL